MLSFRRSRTGTRPQVPKAMQSMQQQAQDERSQHRQSLIDAVQKSRHDLRRAEADIFAKSAPIETRLTALRSEVQELEARLEPLARERLHAIGICDAEVSEFVDELKQEAFSEIFKFQHIVEETREQVRHGWRCDEIFGSVVSQSRIVGALEELLKAYREADRVAREVADIPDALAAIRERLRQSGIRLIDA
jgi:hypothetical protein